MTGCPQDRGGAHAPAVRPGPARSFRVAPGIRWVVETHSILISDGSTEPVRIEYPEAALWDLVTRRHRTERCVALLAYIAGLDAAGAERLANETLETWERAGFLVSTGDDG